MIIVTIDGNVPSKFAHSFNVMKMAQGFVQCGHDVEVVTLMSLPNILNRVRLGSIQDHYGVSKKIKLKFISPGSLDFFRKTIGAKGFNKKAVNYFKSVKPDFVYCRSFKSVVECIEKEIPCILETHTTNYETEDFLKICKLSDSKFFFGIVTINDQLKHAYNMKGVTTEKILVAEDGVDHDQFKINDDKAYWRQELNINSGRKIVVYAGSLYREKGIEVLLKSMKLLNKFKDIELLICGGTQTQIDEWTGYVEKNEILNVTFRGFIPNSDLPGYLKSSDVLAMPFDLNLNYKVMDINTTSPMKLFEYMAAKRPIVSSNICTISKVLENGTDALLSEPGDHISFSESILELINNNDLAQKISENSYKKSFEFSWKGRCTKIINFFGLNK